MTVPNGCGNPKKSTARLPEVVDAFIYNIVRFKFQKVHISMGNLIFLKNPAEAGPTWNSFNVIVFINQYGRFNLRKHDFYFNQAVIFKIIFNPEKCVFSKFKLVDSNRSFKINYQILLSHFINFNILDYFSAFSNNTSYYIHL